MPIGPRPNDSGFATEAYYQLPAYTAGIFANAGALGHVLDVGAGKGLCGEAMAALGINPIDATDISTDMLDMAMRKDIYRDAIEADLTQGLLPLSNDSYAGIVSSGTFTTGHVGPDAMDDLLRIAKPQALFEISISQAHFQAAGFEVKLGALGDRIADLSLPEVAIYGSGNTSTHKNDRALVALFRKV